MSCFHACAGTLIVYVQDGDTLATIAARYQPLDEYALQHLNQTECGPLDMDADLTGWETVNLPLGGKCCEAVRARH